MKDISKQLTHIYCLGLTANRHTNRHTTDRYTDKKTGKEIDRQRK